MGSKGEGFSLSEKIERNKATGPGNAQPSLEGSGVSPVPHTGTKPLFPSLPTPQCQASPSGLLERNRRAQCVHQRDGQRVGSQCPRRRVFPCCPAPPRNSASMWPPARTPARSSLPQEKHETASDPGKAAGPSPFHLGRVEERATGL